MAEKHTHEWHELARVIPWQDADHDPAKLQPETFRDEEGKPRTDMEPPELVPHIILQCNSNECGKTTKVVKIPAKNYEAIRKQLESGELLPSELSTLHLRDLVPSAAEHLSDAGAKRSGAHRGVVLEGDEA